MLNLPGLPKVVIVWGYCVVFIGQDVRGVVLVMSDVSYRVRVTPIRAVNLALKP